MLPNPDSLKWKKDKEIDRLLFTGEHITQVQEKIFEAEEKVKKIIKKIRAEEKKHFQKYVSRKAESKKKEHEERVRLAREQQENQM